MHPHEYGFVADAQRNLQKAHRVEVKREIQAKYALRMSTASGMKRLWLKVVMRVEVWSKLRRIGSSYSLYSHG